MKLTTVLLLLAVSIQTFAQGFPPGGPRELRFEITGGVLETQIKVDAYNAKLKALKDANNSALAQFEAKLKADMEKKMQEMMASGSMPDMNVLKTQMEQEKIKQQQALKELVDQESQAAEEDCPPTNNGPINENIKDILEVNQSTSPGKPNPATTTPTSPASKPSERPVITMGSPQLPAQEEEGYVPADFGDRLPEIPKSQATRTPSPMQTQMPTQNQMNQGMFGYGGMNQNQGMMMGYGNMYQNQGMMMGHGNMYQNQGMMMGQGNMYQNQGMMMGHGNMYQNQGMMMGYGGMNQVSQYPYLNMFLGMGNSQGQSFPMYASYGMGNGNFYGSQMRTQSYNNFQGTGMPSPLGPYMYNFSR